VGHLLDLASPDRAASRRSIRSLRQPKMPGLRPGRRVVALWEVEEMPHPRHPAYACSLPNPAISETCRPARTCSCSGRRWLPIWLRNGQRRDPTTPETTEGPLNLLVRGPCVWSG